MDSPSPVLSSPSLSEEKISSYHSDYYYQIYEFTIQSELPLPQLRPGRGPLNGRGAADIVVRFGPIPPSLENPADEGPAWQATQDEFLLTVLGVARYWIRQGKEIWIERDPQADDADVRTFLLGSTLGVLLHQRQIWALHASAIRTERGAVLFAGKSGAGKSTLLRGMLNRGYAMMADDVSGIVIDAQGHPQVLSAFPHMRMWADTAKQFELSTENVPRVRKSLEKFLFPVKNFIPEPAPLHAVYLLVPHNKPEFELRPIENVSKFACLLRHTYRRKFVQGLGWGAGHFQLITQALQPIRVVGVRRPQHGFLLDELIAHIETDLAHCGEGG